MKLTELAGLVDKLTFEHGFNPMGSNDPIIIISARKGDHIYSKAVYLHEFDNDEFMEFVFDDIIQKLTFKEETKC